MSLTDIDFFSDERTVNVDNVKLAAKRFVAESQNIEYGKDYKYAHDFEGGFVADNYWPEALAEKPPRLLQLTGRGMEKTLLERLRHWWGEKYEEK